MKASAPHAAACVALSLLLAGCAAQAPRRAPPPAAAATEDERLLEAQRLAWLAQRPAWSLQGRLAVSQAGKGGSGRIEWRQQGDRYEVSLGAPVTRQSWRLSGDSGGARLEGLEGGAREGADAALLLLEATGWAIPVREMASWVRGLAADAGRDGPAPASSLSPTGGRPASIDQYGWRVDYQDWYAPDLERPALPKRIEARYREAKLRLIVDEWDFSPP